MAELYREKDVVGNIASVRFSFMSSEEMAQMSHVCIESPHLYMKDEPGKPHPLGPLSRQMGTSQKMSNCATCGKAIDDCPGHYGYINLPFPVYHWGYFNNVVQIMQNICKVCSRLLLKPDVIAKFVQQLRFIRKDYLRKKVTLKKVNELCKKAKVCPHCGERNGVVKKTGLMKITHEKFRGAKKDDEVRRNYCRQYDAIIQHKPDLVNFIPNNPVEIYYPDQVLHLFKHMDPQDFAIICMDEQISHPKNLILTRLLVAPNCVRPSVVSDLKKPGSNEDDITNIMSLILFINDVMTKRVRTGKLAGLQEAWEMLQAHVALLINSEITLPPELNLRNRKGYSAGFVQRLKGKQGRFRGNLSGKRVDYSARTVISPDPNLKITQVGVPVEVAKTLTYPERVTPHNMELMRQLMINGPDVYPGAIYFEHKSTPGLKKSIRHLKKTIVQLSQNLREGDTIERHLMDGDIVLFNRQPSLHKMSIMAHRAKVLPWRTFRFNECVCGPYNADFDGDEMNLHLPQTEEAKAEAFSLMGVTSNLITPRSGALIIGATQDFLTGCYLLTHKDKFFDLTSASELVMSIAESGVNVELPVPAILKPQRMWTGKQLFSLVLRPNKDNPIKVNLIHDKCKKDKECGWRYGRLICISDNYVHIRNSELLCGVLDKGMLGAGSKKNVFYTILKDYGKEEAAEAMWRVSRISIKFLMMLGFSIGIGDLSASPSLLKTKEALVYQGNAACDDFIEQLARNELECAPGCNAEESLEQVILSELSKIRESAGKECTTVLTMDNAALVMATSGSKGSTINISQMIACVGQQAISGTRVPDGFTNRSLPHYLHHAKLPAAKGFVSNSFFSGLTPSEFLFHTMGGREGLVDTAVKTAETGYMQRRLVKCLEDLYVAYDGTVRNSKQDVIQFKYGDDGLDPAQIETATNNTQKNSIKKKRDRGKEAAAMKQEKGKEARLKEKEDCLNENKYCLNEKEDHIKEKEDCIKEKDHTSMNPISNDSTEEEEEEKMIIAPPLDFKRIFYHVKAVINEETKYLDSTEVKQATMQYLEFVEEELKAKSTIDFRNISETFKASIVQFMEEESIKMAKSEVYQKKAEDVKGGKWTAKPMRALTLNQVIGFVASLYNRYVGSSTSSTDGHKLEVGPGIMVEAGTGVGALCAQSIGEPATQMTLKTFHFAGVAAMNITLGVPRIKEIINATKCISTPIITAQLLDNRETLKARQVKARIEKTLLRDICDFIKYVAYGSGQMYIIKLSCSHINLLELKVSAESVKYSICTSKMKVSESQVTVESSTLLTLRPNEHNSRVDPFHQMQAIAKFLPQVVVKGLPTISRAVIHQRQHRADESEEEGPVYELLVEGDNLREVIATYGVDGTKCRSNNIVEVQNTLGIEAARQTIIDEITHTMSSHGLCVDCRHVSLLADLMTCRGLVHGITRHGLAKINDSVLVLASFEKTADHLFEAAYHGQVNEINGVTDCIIMGKPINIGTGIFKMTQQHKRSDAVPVYQKLTATQQAHLAGEAADGPTRPAPGSTTRRSLLFDVPELHIPMYGNPAYYSR